MKTHCWNLCLLAASLSSICHAEWNAFRGPNHDGTIDEKVVITGPAPKELWRVPIGEGFGTVAISGGKVFAMAEGAKQEACLALDAKTGKALWHFALDNTLFENQGGNGPRTTPAVDGKSVYVTGTHLRIACLNADTGKPVWQHDLMKEFGGGTLHPSISKWGNAISPVVDDKRVYFAGGGAGQSLLAFDKLTGKVVWKVGDEKITHATPTLATIHGIPQVIFFCVSGLVSLDPATGAELWRYPFAFKVSSAASPVVSGDMVFCAAGYGVGAGCVKITKQGSKLTATELWRKQGDMMNHWMTPLAKDGYVYGLFGFRALNTAPLQCIEMSTGTVRWSKDGFGQGGVILAGDSLVVQGDRGQVAIVKASSDKYTETASFQPVAGKCWNAAVVSGGRLYARSTNTNPRSPAKGELACFDVSGGK